MDPIDVEPLHSAPPALVPNGTSEEDVLVTDASEQKSPSPIKGCLSIHGPNPKENILRTPPKIMVPRTEFEITKDDQPVPFQFIKRNTTIEITISQSKRPQRLIDESSNLDWPDLEKKDSSSPSQSLFPPLTSNIRSTRLSIQSKKATVM